MQYCASFQLFTVCAAVLPVGRRHASLSLQSYTLSLLRSAVQCNAECAGSVTKVPRARLQNSGRGGGTLATHTRPCINGQYCRVDVSDSVCTRRIHLVTWGTWHGECRAPIVTGGSPAAHPEPRRHGDSRSNWRTSSKPMRQTAPRRCKKHLRSVPSVIHY